MAESAAGSWQTAVASALAEAKRVVVCGIGNDLRGDDAAGILCLKSAKRQSLEAGTTLRELFFIDGGETPENHTGPIRAFQPDLVLLVDAARSGRSAGDIFVIEKENIADEDVSTHRISLRLLVRFIEETIGARVLFLGIEPETTEAGAPVSPAVCGAVSALAGFLGRFL